MRECHRRTYAGNYGKIQAGKTILWNKLSEAANPRVPLSGCGAVVVLSRTIANTQLDDRAAARWWGGRRKSTRGGKMRRKLILLRQVISMTLQPACPWADRITLPPLPPVFLLRAPPQGSRKHWAWAWA